MIDYYGCLILTLAMIYYFDTLEMLDIFGFDNLSPVFTMMSEIMVKEVDR